MKKKMTRMLATAIAADLSLALSSSVVSGSSLPAVLAAGPPPPPPPPSRFLWLSDLHYDPYFGKPGALSAEDVAGRGGGRCDWEGPDGGEDGDWDGDSDAPPPLGRTGCDAPLTLVEAAVASAREVLGSGSGPDFVLLTGDLVRHGADLLAPGAADRIRLVRHIMEALSVTLRDAFPGVPVLFALGNNDSGIDYGGGLGTEDAGIRHVAADALGGGGNGNGKDEGAGRTFETAEMERTYRRAGYYSRAIGGGGRLRLLSLSTVQYSVWFRRGSPSPSPSQSGTDDPLGQFAWLILELTEARRTGSRVLIAGHIPPTVGSYRRTQLWEDRYVDAFLSIVGGYPDVVAAMMFGHLHTDEFRALATPPGGGASPSSSLPPLLLAPSITPVHGNNPSYRVVTYDGSGGGDVLDYETYFLDLNRLPDSREWHRLYSFRETYGKALMGGEGGGGGGGDDDGGGPITAAGLTRLIDTLRSDWRTLRTFVSLQRSGAPQPACRRRCRAEWACLLEAATMAEYEGCAPGRWFGLAGLFGGGATDPGRGGGGEGRPAGTAAALLLLLLGAVCCGLSALWCRRHHRGRKERYTDLDEECDPDVHAEGLRLT